LYHETLFLNIITQTFICTFYRGKLPVLKRVQCWLRTKASPERCSSSHLSGQSIVYGSQYLCFIVSS